MDTDKFLQVLSPFYGVWRTSGDLLRMKTSANNLYGSAMDDANQQQREAIMRSSGATAAGFMLFFFLVIFAILIPAVQAFACFGPTNLYLPGWAWGILILLFWPLGLVWLVFKGGCPSSAASESAGQMFGSVMSSRCSSGDDPRIGLPAMPGLFGNGDGKTTAILLSPGDTMDDGSSLFS